MLKRTAWGGHLMLDFLRRSDAYYQVLSSRSKAYLISHGFRAERIVHIPNGIDTEKFRPSDSPTIEERTDHPILCVARLNYAKGVDVLLQAWALLQRRLLTAPRSHPPRLLLVGEGDSTAQLKRLALHLGIEQSVEFLGQQTDIVPLLQRSQAFVLPSRWEGMPNALLEAMSSGLPCIATRVSGSEDVIKHGINGLLVEPEQPAQLAKALHQVIEDRSLAAHLANEARLTIVNEYRLEAIVARCLHLYTSLVNADTQPSSHASSLDNPWPVTHTSGKEVKE